MKAIRQSYFDDLPRLVFADWLDENGQGTRAEFIRLQISLNKGEGDTDKLKAREQELLRDHRSEILPNYTDEGGRTQEFPATFERGFPILLLKNPNPRELILAETRQHIANLMNKAFSSESSPFLGVEFHEAWIDRTDKVFDKLSLCPLIKLKISSSGETTHFGVLLMKSVSDNVVDLRIDHRLARSDVTYFDALGTFLTKASKMKRLFYEASHRQRDYYRTPPTFDPEHLDRLVNAKGMEKLTELVIKVPRSLDLGSIQSVYRSKALRDLTADPLAVLDTQSWLDRFRNPNRTYECEAVSYNSK